jgi:hypothetical protein
LRYQICSKAKLERYGRVVARNRKNLRMAEKNNFMFLRKYGRRFIEKNGGAG